MTEIVMRYEARWANGVWRVFDTHEYRTVQTTFGPTDEWLLNRADAIELAIQANEAESLRKQRRRG